MGVVVPGEKKKKIMKSAPSAKKKTLGTVLWDEKCYILVDFVPRETTLNSSCYVAGLHGTEALHVCCFEVCGVVGGERKAILTIN